MTDPQFPPVASTEYPMSEFGLKWYLVMRKYGVPQDMRDEFVVESIEMALSLLENATGMDLTHYKLTFGEMAAAIIRKREEGEL